MSYCVPDWDEHGEELIGLHHPGFFCSSAKGRPVQAQRRKPGTYAPEHASEALNWMERQSSAMQGEDDERGGGSKRQLCAWTANEQRGGGGATSGKQTSGDRDGNLDGLGRQSVPAVDVPLSNSSLQDDELLSWLQYPLEDTFDRNYCSTEIFGELLNPHVHLLKDSFIHQALRDGDNRQESADSNRRGLASSDGGAECAMDDNNNNNSRAVSADAAMAMGAGRAAGVLCRQAGAEAFHGVLTSSVQPSLARASTTGQDAVSGLSSASNFHHFSRPVAKTKTQLKFLGASSGPTNVERARQPFEVPAAAPCEPSISESNPTVLTGIGSSRHSESSPPAGRAPGPGNTLPPAVPFRQELDAGKDKVELSSSRLLVRSFSCSAVEERGTGAFETGDAIATSPSGGSGNSFEKATEEPRDKRKTCSAEECEYLSEDVEEVVAHAKKPPSGRSSASKRARAAEIHNQSERRRRDKIKDRMKALQELIPNANKSDKASMLDEAIEYVKLLQAQLQLMSMRTGMVVPPTMMPRGMQYVPIQQMPALPSMGMGMGLGMGMGMGMAMMDVSNAGPVASAGRAVIPLAVPGQSFPGLPYHAAGFQPGSSPVTHGAQGHFQTSHVRQPYNLLPVQQQLQPMHLNMQSNVDVYRALQQQQQQQQHTQQNPSSKAIQ